MVSTRISFAILAAYVATVAVAKPYSAELFERSELAEDDVVRREVAASRPYAAELYEREFDSEASDIVIRSPEAMEINPLDILNIRSTVGEDMHERAMVEDSGLEKRAHKKCKTDARCGKHGYCSASKGKCYKKLANKKKCSRNEVCESDFCNPATDKCQAKKQIGSRCRGDDNQCKSGYCSVITDRCHKKSGYKGHCYVDAGCKKGLYCVNGKCRKHAPSPAPSGSAQYPRELTEVEA